MSVVFATLLVVAFSVVPAIDMVPATAEPATRSVDGDDNPDVLDAERVATLAAAASTQAKILHGEHCALSCELDRDNSAQCAQVALIQAVLKDLAADRRDDSAADALDAFYRIIALQQQLNLLSQSNDVLDSLLRMAERAEELDLPDGDVFDLRHKQLDVQDQLIVVRFGIRKLRRRLASAIDWPLAQVESATLLPSSQSDNSVTDESTALALALMNRGDYRATQTLCRCLNTDSLLAAKLMMGMLQPGTGLALPKGSTAILTKLAHRSNAASDLACRRRQCDSLTEASRDLIEQQIAQGILDFDEANERLVIAMDIEQSTIASTRHKTSAEKIDKAPAGAQKLASLTELKRRADRFDRERDVMLADVRLRRALGTLVSD